MIRMGIAVQCNHKTDFEAYGTMYGTERMVGWMRPAHFADRFTPIRCEQCTEKKAICTAVHSFLANDVVNRCACIG